MARTLSRTETVHRLRSLLTYESRQRAADQESRSAARSRPADLLACSRSLDGAVALI